MSSTPPFTEHFKVTCPAIKKDIVMTKETWFGHILSAKHGNRKCFTGKEAVIQAAIQGITETKHFFRFSDSPKSEWFADCSSVYFNPFFLRIAFKKIEDDIIIVATLLLISRGVLSYEP